MGIANEVEGRVMKKVSPDFQGVCFCCGKNWE